MNDAVAANINTRLASMESTLKAAVKALERIATSLEEMEKNQRSK